MRTPLKTRSSGSRTAARAVVTLALGISILPIVNCGGHSAKPSIAATSEGDVAPTVAAPATAAAKPAPGTDTTAKPKPAPGTTSTSTDVRSPTSTSTDVRSPTSTSTQANTAGNVTVTGGAGAGATTTVIIRTNPTGEKKSPPGMLAEWVNPLGQTVQRAIDSTGKIVERTLDTTGKALSEKPAGSLLDLPVISATTNDKGQPVKQARDTTGAIIEYTVVNGQIINSRVVTPAPAVKVP